MATFTGKDHRAATVADLVVGTEVFGPYVPGDHGTITGAPDSEGWVDVQPSDGSQRVLLNAERIIVRREAAKAVTRGGYDGVLVTFGDGTDDDTVNATLFHYPLIKITMRDGEEFDAWEASATWAGHGVLVVEYQPTDDHGTPTDDERQTVGFEDVVEVHIY